MIHFSKPPRILITRLSAIGDCIHTTPLVCAIRDHFPEAFVGWVTQAGPAKLLSGMEGLDTLIVTPRNWMTNWKVLRQLRHDLLEHHFDVAIDPQSLTKSSLLGWLSGARHRIGFTRGQARELSPWISTCPVEPQTDHVVTRYLELLRPLGIESPAVEFNLPVDTSAMDDMDRFLTKHHLPEYALINPGAGWESKLWPHERYANVAEHLFRSYGMKSIILWAGDCEKNWASAIVNRAKRASVMAPDTSLPALASLCRGASLFVGSDTGPMHLAAAVHTPCVAMYGPTRIAVCGPFGEGHRALQAFYQDGTSKERRGSDNRAMRAITSADVCTACDELLRGQKGRVA